MKIGMQTWGSHGDIRPFLALAEGLQADGHEVHLSITCVDSEAYQNVASARGVRISATALAIVAAHRPGQIAEMIATFYKIRDPMKQMQALLRMGFDPVEDAMFEAAQQLAADADLLIGHYFLHPLQIAAEQAGKPYVSVMLSHAGIPSAYNNPLGLRLGKVGNRLLWWLVKTTFNRALRHYPDRLRRQLDMGPAGDIVTGVWLSRALTLVAVSPQICQAQPDWPDAVRVCGFLDMPNIALEGAVPAALEAFLAAGEAPVYMTLGSWMPADIAGQSGALNLLTLAARLAGCRAIIQSPSWRDCGFVPDERILYVSAAPHHAIFPRCAAVLHHGGAGTTQSATLAGKPSIVVAHISEQEHWGRELRRLGIAGKPLHRRSVTAAALARQLRHLLERPEMAGKAQTIAQAMRAENGVAEAVRLIRERFVSRVSR